MKKLLILPMLVFTAVCAFSQIEITKTVNLNDLSEFTPNAGNWFVVGDVTIDPNIDVHQAEAPAAATGKSRKKKNQPVTSPPQAVTFQAGKGVLLNMNSEQKKDNLVTTWEHGDIELELEVMIPKGSNSGIYLQGGYEVQLFDSWGVKNASYSDIGGIYRNWETEPSEIYMGKAPLTNAAKAPGLWQTLKIAFQAPRFNDKGEKIANAKFISVELNGVKIHDNIEVPKLTGGPLGNKERATGPLMIQGDHGAVALRNIRYRLLSDCDVTASDISYKVYHGVFDAVDSFRNLTPFSTGMIPEITWEVAGIDDAFGIIYNGTLNIPRDGDYGFELDHSGSATLSIDNKEVVPDEFGGDSVVSLKKGAHPFELIHYKNNGGQQPSLGWMVTGVNTHTKALNAFSSYLSGGDQTSPILVSVGSEPKLLRAFLDFKGDRSKRLTHTIGVGEPGGIHYVYDLKAGNLVCVWRGDFVDATPMWHDRGDGSFHPLGAVQYLFTEPPFAELADANAAFPAKSDEKEFRSNGYVVGGRPVFSYTYKGTEVTDKIYPDEENKMFTREISFKHFGQSPLYFKIAEGTDIVPMPDGSYAVDDKKYYIHVLSGVAPAIREQPGDKKELVLKADGNPIKYSIIW